MIGAGVHNYVGIYNTCGQKIFELYFSDQLTVSNIHGRTSRRIY